MRISTRKSKNGRIIERLNNPLFDVSYFGLYQPCVCVELTGQDGVSYKIELSDTDLDVLIAARDRYRAEGVWPK